MPLVVVEQPGLALPSPAMPSPDASILHHPVHIPVGSSQVHAYSIRKRRRTPPPPLPVLFFSSSPREVRTRNNRHLAAAFAVLQFAWCGGRELFSVESRLNSLAHLKYRANLHHKQFWRHKQLRQLTIWHLGFIKKRDSTEPHDVRVRRKH